MQCSCQIATLRVFVRSIVQTPSLHPYKPQSWTLPLRPLGRRATLQPSSASIQRRTLYSTRPALDAAGESAANATNIAPPGASTTRKRPAARSHDQSQQRSTPALVQRRRRSDDGGDRNGSHKAYKLQRDSTQSRHQGMSPIRLSTKPDRRRKTTDEPKPTGWRKNRARAQEEIPADANDAETPPKREEWQVQKRALAQKFPEGWSPHKKLSPDALEGIRALHAQYPDMFTTEALAKRFEMSPEAIRRILKSKWRPTPEEEEARQNRWFNRGKNVWSRWADMGKKPPQKWRREGIVRDPSWNAPRPSPEGEAAGPGRGVPSKGKRMRLRRKAEKKLAESII